MAIASSLYNTTRGKNIHQLYLHLLINICDIVAFYTLIRDDAIAITNILFVFFVAINIIFRFLFTC